ncbi:MAG: hypothetical protein WCE21_00020 [Candidatus Babeliales bacterium]
MSKHMPVIMVLFTLSCGAFADGTKDQVASAAPPLAAGTLVTAFQSVQATAIPAAAPFSIQSLAAQLKDKQPTPDNPLFVGYQQPMAVRPNRDRIDQLKVNEYIKELQKKNRTEDNNKSFFAATNPFKVVVAQFESLLPATQNKAQEPFAIVLLGDHELFYAAQVVGAMTVPLEVVGTFVGPEKDFWDQAINTKNWVYQQIPPRQFTRLKDDTNLYFVSLITRRCIDKKTSTGAEYPVLIAFDAQFKRDAGDDIRPDVPFQELVVADMLRKLGIAYSHGQGTTLDSDPLKSFVEKARAALVGQVKALRADPRTSNEYGALIKVVPERTKWSDINAGTLWSYKGEKL